LAPLPATLPVLQPDKCLAQELIGRSQIAVTGKHLGDSYEAKPILLLQRSERFYRLVYTVFFLF
jgi:hypothetical protein